MKLLKVIGSFFSFLLSIIFCLVLFLFISSIFVKNSCKEEVILDYVKKANIMKLPANDLLNEKGKLVEDALEKELSKYGATDNLLDEIIDEYKFEELIANYASSYTNYFILNKEKPILKEADVFRIINSEMIESYANRILTNKEKTSFNNLVINSVKIFNDSIPNKEEVFVIDSIPFATKVINFIYSDNFNYIVVANLALIFILIAILTWSIYKPLGFLGVSTTVVGCLISSWYFIQKIVIKYIIKNDGTIESLVKKLANVVSKSYLLYGLIVLAIGILILLVFRIISDFVYQKRLKQVEKEMQQEPNPKKRKVNNPETEIIGKE